MIRFIDNNLEILFSQWDPESYRVFLQSKKLPEYRLDYDWRTDTYKLTAPARFAYLFGMRPVVTDRGWIPIANHLFDYQAFIARVALDSRRYAVWCDTGLGKTIIALEFARQVCHRTDGRVLLIVPLNIMQQWIDEAARFYGDSMKIHRCRTREDLKAWCSNGPGSIGIVNHEKFIPRDGDGEIISEIRHCAGVILDEASILKAGGGKIKWALIKSCKGIEYKLSLTATPAPNDTMEYASQGSFLEKLRNEGEILWTYFTRTQDGEWKVKKHAESAFYRFMSGWSVYLRSPKNYGFADNLKDLPSPDIREYRLPLTPEQRHLIQAVPDSSGQLSLYGNRQKLSMVKRSKYGQLAKGFIYRGSPRKVERIPSLKPGFVADLIRKDVNDGLQVLVWTVFDEESQIVSECIGDSATYSAEVLSGKTPADERVELIEAFRNGHLQVLISKASLLGFGLNLQNCGSMIFSGFNDSFEQLYQAVRRAYRYGQKKSVRVHIPYIPELEGVVWRNVMKKQAKFERDTARQERNYLEAMKGALEHHAAA